MHFEEIESMEFPEARRAMMHHYFDSWMIHEPAARKYTDHAAGLDVEEHFRQLNLAGGKVKRSELSTRAGTVAVIDINGVLMKHYPSFIGGTSTAEARRAVRQAANSDGVSAIVLRIDSPGGTTAGTADLADDIAKANQVKPVIAFIEDLGASAAYWVASQAGKIFANRTALVGSIGTYAVVQDSSKRAEGLGVKVHLVKSGEFKGVGQPGTPVDDRQIAYLQQRIDDSQKFFTEAVAKGRKLPLDHVEKLADGSVYHAPKAEKLGLIDGVTDFFELMGDLRREAEAAEQLQALLVERLKGQDPDQPAGLSQIRDICEGAGVEFIQEQKRLKATPRQAYLAWQKLNSDKSEN